MFKEVSDETRLSHFRRMIEAHQLAVSGDYGHAQNIGTEFYELITRINERERQLGAALGWDEAMTTQIQRLISGDPNVERFQMPANPYRADRLVGDE